MKPLQEWATNTRIAITFLCKGAVSLKGYQKIIESVNRKLVPDNQTNLWQEQKETTQGEDKRLSAMVR